MSYVSDWKYQDGITDILAENGIDSGTFEIVADTLAEWLDRQEPADEPAYLVMGGLLKTAGELAEDVRVRSQIGVSYVETFIAGAVSNERLGLEVSLEALRKAG